MHSSIKLKSVEELLRKYDPAFEHAFQVRKLSLLIFDKLKNSLHDFSEAERDLLEASALLHDIGHAIAKNEHNKHSYILITSEKIEGFTQKDKEIIGNIARYHKGKTPKNYHECYTKLYDDNSKNLVKKLSGILRLADALDHLHLSLIDDLDCLYDSFSRTLCIVMKQKNPDLLPKLFIAQDKIAPFEEEFGVSIEFKTI